MSEPSYVPISAYPLAFTASTKGTQEGEIQVIHNFSEAYALGDTLKDGIIVLSKVSNIRCLLGYQMKF